jgi:hypothetical protein
MRCSSARWRGPLLLLFLVLSGFLSAQVVEHDRAFWRAIAKNKYAVPSGESADALAMQLSGLLASPDPELRDDLTYSIFARWIYRPNVLTASTLVALAGEWRANLKSGIGESGTDSVLKRSFSALCLSLLAEREAKTPFLGADPYHLMVADAVLYLQAERDLRGYDAKLGWIHATAHTADLMQALAGSSLLTVDEQRSMMSALGERLSSAPQVYSQGEQDRIATAVVALLRRADFDTALFEAWLTRLQDEDKKVWDNPLTPETLARYQNHNYMLQALVARLSLEPESPRITEFKRRVLAILRAR